jgi:drug/metabolite transporter (DMT)-like permease
VTVDAARAGVASPVGHLAPLAVVWLIWGVSYPVTHIALVGLDPWTLRVAVMLLAGGTLLGTVALSGRSLYVPRALWPDLAIAGLCNMTFFQVGTMFGIHLMGAGRTSVLVYTMPIWTTLFARLLLGERVTLRRIAALVLGVLAVVVLLGQGLDQVRNAPLGAALTLFAAASFGFGTVWVKLRPLRLELPVLAGWQLVVGGLPVVPVWLATAPHTDALGAPASSWLAMLFLALLANALAYVLWFRLVRGLPVAVVSVGALVVPCVGVLSSTLMIGETIQRNDLIALALVCGALVLVLFERRRPEPTS